MALRTPFELLRNRRLAALEAAALDGGAAVAVGSGSHVQTPVLVENGGGKFRTVNFNGFWILPGLLQSGCFQQEFDLHRFMRENDGAALGAIEDAGRQQRHDIRMHRLHVAGRPDGRLRGWKRDRRRTATEQLPALRRQHFPQQFGRGETDVRGLLALAAIPCLANPAMASSGARTSSVTVFMVPPRDVMLKVGEQCLRRREGIRALSFLP